MEGINPWLALLTTGGFGTVAAAIIAGLFARKKVSAEASSAISSAGAGIAGQVESFVQRLTEQNEKLSSENERLSEQILQLRHENADLKLELARLRREVQALTKNMSAVTQDVSAVTENVSAVRADTKAIRAELNALGTDELPIMEPEPPKPSVRKRPPRKPGE